MIVQQRGFALLEVLLALLIVAIGLLALAKFNYITAQRTNSALELDQASAIFSGALALARMLPGKSTEITSLLNNPIKQILPSAKLQILFRSGQAHITMQWSQKHKQHILQESINTFSIPGAIKS